MAKLRGNIVLAGLLGLLAISCGDNPVEPERTNVLDQQHPQAGGDPFGLSATIGAGAVTLQWNAITSPPVAQYCILRRVGTSGNFAYLHTVPDSVQSYQDASIAFGQTYAYKIAALDEVGEISDFSHQVAVTVHSLATFTINDDAMYTVTRAVTLHVNAADCDSLWIWDGALADSSSGQWRTKQAASTTLDWTLPTGTGTKTVHARLHYLSGQRRVASDSIVLDQIPPVVADMVPTPANGATESSNSVTLSWTAATDTHSGVSGYRVLLGTQDPPTTQVFSGSALAWESGALAWSTTYFWRVVAEDTAGNEAEGAVWSFTTADLPDQFIWLASGTYTRGSPVGEPQRGHDETQHQVTLSGFWMSPYEVTEALWSEVMGGSTTSELPKVSVRWHEAVEFCNALSLLRDLTPAYTINGTTVTWNRSANGYRLPTEAEWEYACRAGTTQAFNNGTNCLSSSSEANYDGRYPLTGCPPGPYHGGRRVVGHDGSPNAWGLHDLHGNVSEWCWDWYWSYPPGPVTDPAGPTSGSIRVHRGGSWRDYAQYCRSAYRDFDSPSYASDDLGFRLARSAL